MANMPAPPPGFDEEVPIPTAPDGFTEEYDPGVGLAEDVTISVPAYAKSVGAGFAGTPGDMRELVHGLGRYIGVNNTPEGQDWLSQGDAALTQKYGLNPDTKILRPLTSEDVTGMEDKLTGGPSYQPQTTLGKDINTGAGLLGASLLGGPEGIAGRLGTEVIAPVVASEGAGQAANAFGFGPEGEQVARGIGMLAGHPTAGTFAALNSSRRARMLIPTTESVHDQASATFKAAGLDNVQLEKHSYAPWAVDTYQKLKSAGWTPSLGGQAKDTIEEIVNTMNNKYGITLGDVERIRQQANNLYKVGGENRENIHRFAHIITDSIDEFTHNLKPTDVTTGNYQQAVGAVDNARALWARYRKAQKLDNIVSLAEGKAQANFTNAGFQTAVRQGVNALLKRIQDKREVGWTPAEISALKAARNPGGIGTIMKTLSNFSPRGWGGLVLGGITGNSTFGAGDLIKNALAPVIGAGLSSHLGGVLPLFAAGEGARQLGNALSRRAIEHARDIAASGVQLAPLHNVANPGGVLGALYGTNRVLNEGQ